MADNPNYDGVDNVDDSNGGVGDAAAGVENTGVEPGSETDRLLDAATTRIGNEPNDEGSLGDFEDVNQDAVDGTRNVTEGDHGETPDQLRSDIER
ncbi:hypothetical protein CGLAU_10045 [Corynebacterium glaucum]|uniref:Uncharacterized protein n=1 Tax=Corynebacterium glaucum TaxID=187491 RepID=A0A1Q2HYM9_9CORY|nr:hypothetical protein [Corynebacterium glaucum]AQQ15957.1 hypothetical protein CGLAU_10045 [Corynebacterium glaucum]WJZ08438.1 hypothetical protein CGLAUT_09830 [Corynebacterium glaucum]